MYSITTVTILEELYFGTLHQNYSEIQWEVPGVMH